MPLTQQGIDKNIIDAIRKALQLPIYETLSPTSTGTTPSFSLTATQSTFNVAALTAAAIQPAIHVVSVNGFQGTVVLTAVTNMGTCSGVTATLGSASEDIDPSTDAYDILNIVIGSCPVGNYTVVVTGTYGTETETVTITINVNATVNLCPNGNSDCGGSGQCVGGICYYPNGQSCTVDSDCAAGCKCISGSCYCPNQPKCKKDSDCGANQVCLGGNCYAQCCDADDNYCKSLNGPCSVCKKVQDASCGCRPIDQGGCWRCTTGSCAQLTISCPAQQTVCSSTAPQTINNTFSITNTTGEGYNVDIAIAEAPGTQCSCCTPPVITPSGYSIGPNATVNHTLSVGSICAADACYDYIMTVTVKAPWTNALIQTLSCTMKVCLTSGPCFVLEIQDYFLDGAWGGSASSIAGYTGCALQFNPACGQPGCCSLAGLFNVRLRSLNGFVGTVHVTCSSDCNGACGLAGDYSLSAGQTRSLGTVACACTTSKNDPGCPYYHGSSACGTESCSGVVTLTGTSGAITSTAVGFGTGYSAYCL